MGIKLDNSRVNEILKELSKEYDIYAPKRFPKAGRYSDTDMIRYDIVKTAEEIVFDEKSDMPAKEVYGPITQTLFYFTEDEFRASKAPTSKKILIFMRPCDINAMEHQNQIYFGDMYYQRMRDKLKIVMIECTKAWDTCFCVSMGSNKTTEYSLAVRPCEDGWLVDVKDEEFKKVFAGEETEFTPEYVTENELTLTVPEIKNKEILNKLKAHDMWKEYNSRCISCGACTIACATCTCFTTTDIAYNENSNVGERRRTSASCQIEGFTRMAGGHEFRTTAGDRMRYKVLHKFHDYKARFEDYHMCVGCGRCIDRCPEFISIVATVEKMAKAIEEIEKEVG
ncbi:MAG: anaerobic sulfite reductase subunit AsrA [Erysipelotrichaceae bacterium]|nr:anaerobic sulfite reductase subunit AsrA [Erysipelotrichaceae bacterium]